jgi:hypothetical protein
MTLTRRAPVLIHAGVEQADMAAHGRATSPTLVGGERRRARGLRLFHRFRTSRPRRCHGPSPRRAEHLTESIYEKYMKESLKNHLAGVKMLPEPFFAELTALVGTIGRNGSAREVGSPISLRRAFPPIRRCRLRGPRSPP